MPPPDDDTWAPAIGAWASSLRAAGRPHTTVTVRTAHVRALGLAVAPTGPWGVTGDELVGWFGSTSWARNTRRSYRASVRGFYGWAVATERVPAPGPAAALPAVPQVPPRPRPASERDYLQALAAATPRVGLMVRLAGELGLRRGEVARVHGRDVVADLAGWSLLVHGKGGRQRVVPMADGLADAVRAAAAGGWAFPGGVGGHLGPERVGKLVADVLPAGVSMHQLRHRFATLAYRVDTDLLTVQRLLGHASPGTTLAYVAHPDGAARATVVAVADGRAGLTRPGWAKPG